MKIKVAILGATGAVGQKFITLLENHPYFTITNLVASEKSAGQKYGERVNWLESTPIPENIREMKIQSTTEKLPAKILFSALDSSCAWEIEKNYAENGYIVISNAKNHRLENDVPLLVPEINKDHLSVIENQKTKGFIITNPNCVSTILSLAIFPIYQKFGITDLIVTTMQAVSGAGYPGVASLDILGNVIPAIDGEEEKVESEPKKIFGTLQNKTIQFANINISANCNRVPVLNGHTMDVSFKLKNYASSEELKETLTNFSGINLPSSPTQPILYFANAKLPQPRFLEKNGMQVAIGNLRKCPVLDYKMTICGNNTIRGAAGGAILNAELLYFSKYLRN